MKNKIMKTLVATVVISSSFAVSAATNDGLDSVTIGGHIGGGLMSEMTVAQNKMTAINVNSATQDDLHQIVLPGHIGGGLMTQLINKKNEPSQIIQANSSATKNELNSIVLPGHIGGGLMQQMTPVKA